MSIRDEVARVHMGLQAVRCWSSKGVIPSAARANTAIFRIQNMARDSINIPYHKRSAEGHGIEVIVSLVPDRVYSQPVGHS